MNVWANMDDVRSRSACLLLHGVKKMENENTGYLHHIRDIVNVYKTIDWDPFKNFFVPWELFLGQSFTNIRKRLDSIMA